MARDRRVLVVDPDPEAVAATLETLAVTTLAAADPAEARSLLDERPVDCVVTGPRFERPDTDQTDSDAGLADRAFLDHLRERDPTLPVVVYTDADLARLDPTALVGTTACVPKGDDDAETRLREWVERAVDARTRERDRLAGVVHDLRTPLRAANVSLARLRRDLDADAEAEGNLDDETRDHLGDLAASHERLGALLDDLDALRDAGRPVVDTGPVDLADVASDAWRTVDTRGATLRVETDATLPADDRKLRRLFDNLFVNAVEHGAVGERSDDLTVEVGSTDDGFYVADDGPGIPSEDREVVFERGYSTVDGTGYGLAIVAELAAAHDWSIGTAESESDGARIEIET